VSGPGASTAADPPACQVWWVRTADVVPAHDVLLAPSDLQRRARLAQEADRRRLTAAAAVARSVLGARTGTAPAALRIDRTCPRCGAPHGRPVLPDVPDLHFSVAHAGDWAVVAVLHGAPVGVDVEGAGRFTAAELEQLADFALAPAERAELSRLPDFARPCAFTTYWVRKEAVVKATGEGLAVAPADVVVSPPWASARLLRRAPGPDATGSSDPAARPVTLHDLHPPPGHAAALAVVGRGAVRVVEQDAGPLLRAAAAGTPSMPTGRDG
jgi:4'-phosphopantetheinyl transferase